MFRIHRYPKFGVLVFLVLILLFMVLWYPPCPPRRQGSTNTSNSAHVRSRRMASPTNYTNRCFRLLLVIIFNRPDFYDNLDFLREFHGRFFKHVVFYGPGQGSRLLMPDGVRPSLDEGGGNFQQRTAVRAMKDHPDFDGYLWIGDDVWLNTPYLLSTMDPEKIWLNPENETNWIDKKFQRKKWRYWAIDMGVPAVRRHLDLIPKKFVGRMKEVFGAEQTVIRSFSDVVYIPRRFVKDFITVAGELPDVNFEIAIPTALNLVSRRDDRAYFPEAIYLWSKIERRCVASYWSPTLSFVHPLKFSSSNSRQLARQWIDLSVQATNFARTKQFTC